MNKRIKKLWLKALRSGEYKHTKHKLRRHGHGYCCLGVLCDLHSSETDTEWDGDYYLHANVVLPTEVIVWAGLKSGHELDNEGQLPPGSSAKIANGSGGMKKSKCLTGVNDSPKTKGYTRVANLIERYF